MVRRIRKRDRKLVALWLAHAICIAGFLVTGVGAAAVEPRGWRRIDVDKVEHKIRAGDLVRHEADWWRPAQDRPAGRAP